MPRPAAYEFEERAISDNLAVLTVSRVDDGGRLGTVKVWASHEGTVQVRDDWVKPLVREPWRLPWVQAARRYAAKHLARATERGAAPYRFDW